MGTGKVGVDQGFEVPEKKKLNKIRQGFVATLLFLLHNSDIM